MDTPKRPTPRISRPRRSLPAIVARPFVWLRRVVPFFFLALVGALAWHELRQIDVHALRASLREVPFTQVLLLQALALLAVLSMSLYDWRVSGWLKLELPRLTLLRYSWVANTFNNFLGVFGLAGSGIRLLLLARDGTPPRTASLYSGVVMLSVPVGLSVLVLPALVLGGAMAASLPLPRWLALTVLGVFGAYLPGYLLLIRSGPLLERLIKTRHPLEMGLGLSLLLISVIDWVLAIAVAWCCLAVAGGQVLPGTFLAAFTLAAALGVLSLIPGGLGVFDGTMLLMLSAAGVAGETVLTGLALFRLVYYLVPWLIALYLGTGLVMSHDAGLLARLARHWQASPVLALLRIPLNVLASLGVRLLGILTFAAGVILLTSAAFPGLHERLSLLDRYVPLPAVELSHLLSVAVGVLLIAVARGITGQVRTAYRLTMSLLLIGAVLSLLKGIDFEEASALLLVAGLLRLRRQDFHRESYPLVGARGLYWLVALVLCVAGYVLLGAWVHGEGVLSADLWLKFGHGLDAPRFLRSLPIAVLVLLGFLGWTLFRTPGPRLSPPGPQDLRQAKAFLDTHGGHNFAHLVFMADKYLFYSGDGRALIPFARVRDRLVALGDPLGEVEAFDRAIAEFRDFADLYDLTPVFYEVDEEHLHRYHDSGFSLFKLGECAYVSIPDFTLVGKRNESLRHGYNRARRLGLTFDVLEPPLEEAAWSELGEVSDQWLRTRGGAEKGFSLGRFERDYLSWSPIAVVRQDGRALAFASLMPAYGEHDEFSIDLMRHAADAPPGTMDFLFVSLIEHARSQGYRSFNLGMAPLSGVGKTRYARANEKVARLAFELGNRLYNYKGVRAFKQKFRPRWRSRYLAYPVLTPLPALLADVAALVAGGYRRILFRARV